MDWRVKAVHEGQAIVRMKALTDEESDAMEMNSRSTSTACSRPRASPASSGPKGESARRVPRPRRAPAEQTRLEIRCSPTLAGAMVDALPYLADYPYGCTEQTLEPVPAHGHHAEGS